ncbi:probable calcium-binding protein CML18 [Rhododendron vialii]|uniref:probable calcium-binding protein CML18 n=1 Tax=Rhododendron vialii TaxID=182163 RepID=UPI00266001CB|nr:probable calcium-binding protein CML18 [Rhododendron vialii]
MATNPNADMDELKEVFNKFDANGDGKISFTELVDVMKALGSGSSTDDDVKKMMDEIDTDRDGFISLDEFADFWSKGSATAFGSGAASAELKEAFELYDQDKNGLISAAELHQILTRLGEKCSVEDCGRMIKSVDSDGDGYVSFDEFKKMMGGGGGGDALSK